MGSPITLPDGTRCWSGPNCLRHGAANKLPADFATKSVTEQLIDLENLNNPLATKSEEEIDIQFGELYSSLHEVTVKQSELKTSNLKYARYGDHYQRRIDANNEELKYCQSRIDEIAAEIVPYSLEYKRRGGWSRGFLATSTDGHVHRSNACSTCRPSTQLVLLTAYSGKSEEELVADAGRQACTVCFPSAPVESLGRAPRIKMNGSNGETTVLETKEDKRAKAAEAKAKREAAAEAKAIAGLDGGVLTVPDWHGETEKIHTKNEALREASEAYVNLRAAESGMRMFYPPTYNMYQARYDALVEALAFKDGVSVEEKREELTPKHVAKYKRDYGRYYKEREAEGTLTPYDPNAVHPDDVE